MDRWSAAPGVLRFRHPRPQCLALARHAVPGRSRSAPSARLSPRRRPRESFSLVRDPRPRACPRGAAPGWFREPPRSSPEASQELRAAHAPGERLQAGGGERPGDRAEHPANEYLRSASCKRQNRCAGKLTTRRKHHCDTSGLPGPRRPRGRCCADDGTRSSERLSPISRRPGRWSANAQLGAGWIRCGAALSVEAMSTHSRAAPALLTSRRPSARSPA